MDEKFAELAMEWGIRFYDMVRLGNYAALSYDGRTFTPTRFSSRTRRTRLTRSALKEAVNK